MQGLGLSVTGGVVSATPAPSGCFSPSSAALEACSWPGLIRIKKIFPHGAAWQTNKLAAGDVLLSANGQPLTGCTNYVRSFPAVECVFCCCRYAFGVISHFIMPPEPFTNISTKYSSASIRSRPSGPMNNLCFYCTETGQLKARIVDSATLFNDHCSCQFDSHS